MAPSTYASAPPVKRGEPAGPPYGAGIESREVEPKAGHSYRIPGAAPELKKAEKKAKKDADSSGPTLETDQAPAASRSALEAALPRLKLRLAISDLFSADQVVRQAVTRSGGELVQDATERQVRVRIMKERLPELMERLGRVARIVERPSLPDAAGMLEIEITW